MRCEGIGISPNGLQEIVNNRPHPPPITHCGWACTSANSPEFWMNPSDHHDIL